MIKLNKREFKQWMSALRSGDYQQARGKLQDGDAYCCLGVACKVLIPKRKLFIDSDYNVMIGDMPEDQPNAPEWLKKLDDDYVEKMGEAVDADYGQITILNDKLEYSFDEIADILEAIYIHKVLD